MNINIHSNNHINMFVCRPRVPSTVGLRSLGSLPSACPEHGRSSVGLRESDPNLEKRLHTRNQPLRNNCGFSVTFSDGLSVAFSNLISVSAVFSKGLSLSQWIFTELSNGFSVACSNGISLVAISGLRYFAPSLEELAGRRRSYISYHYYHYHY